MKRMIIVKSQLITMAVHLLLLIVLGASILLLVPTTVMLNCVHYQQKCPEEDLDMYIALEHDFVLLTPDGRHFVLPNLDRGIKTRYLTNDVRISGKRKGTIIWVEKLEAREGNQYRMVWDIQRQQKVEQAP
jgi:hypothetical protein